MKKLFAIAIIGLLSLGSFAQSTSPRFGTTPSKDNTGRVMTYKYVAPAYASSYAVVANASETTVRIDSLTGAQTLTATLTNCYAADQLTIIFKADTLTAGRVVTFSTGFVSAGTLTVDKSQKAAIHFTFDGVAWIETSRAKQ